MSKSKIDCKLYSYVYFSRLIQKSDDFLSVYKSTRKLKGLNAEACYKHFLEAEKYQNKLVGKLQSIYYSFEEYGGKFDFAKFLKDKGIVPCNNSFYQIMERVFFTRETLIYKGHLVRWQLIADSYEEYRRITHEC